ncbi:hypothetical protein PLICRDRAFT_112159, partial [Plicaturopsis crispa FD-325 SS-3]
WVRYREVYLDECMRREGRGTLRRSPTCPGCRQEKSACLRCRDCFGGSLLCVECVVARHKRLPLHIVEQWNGSFFQRVPLRQFALRVQLGHPVGEGCSFKKTGPRDFLVIHVNGLHHVAVDFCECPGQAPPYVQLLRAGWWPATPLEPQTCATMDVLRHFQILNLQGKISAFDFYRALEKSTDGWGLTNLPDRLPSWMRMIRQWRHVEMCKRAGRGLEPTGIAGTSPGELAVACRACPIPGVNLPDDWADASPSQSYLYRLIIAHDANFRLANRMRSTEQADPSLCPGGAYFVATKPYAAFLKNYTHDEEISNCVAFAALMLANMKRAKGIASSGVGGVSCGRHELFRPNGLGDLQKGERYANMDYIFMSSIAGCTLKHLVASYDIACQWSKNFWSRMLKLPERIQLNIPPSNVSFVVPAFHIEAHESKCRNRYSSRRKKGMGRSDLEGVERLWSWIRGAASSTREMGPGHRRDTLDDFCSYANWLKILGMGSLFLRRMVEAIPEAVAHRQAFEDFEEGLRAERPGEIEKWEEMVARWDENPEEPNPYMATESDATMADIRLELAEEERVREQEGRSIMHDSTPSAFILLALDVELVQHTVAAQVKTAGANPTPLQKAGIQDRRTAILKKLRRVRELQAVYMPRLLNRIHPDGEGFDERRGANAEDVRLHLPSSLSGVLRPDVTTEGIVDIKTRLRLAEMSDALDELRRQIQTRSFVHKFRIGNITGQKRGSRTQALIDSVQVRLVATQTRYRRARAAYLALCGPGPWEDQFRVLRNEDVVGPSGQAILEAEEDDTARARDALHLPQNAFSRARAAIDARMDPNRADGGRRKLSWIWYRATSTGQSEENEERLHEALRVEWAKAKARAERWHEEVVLLDEEMRRVLVYGRWKAEWWESRAARREDASPELAEGLRSYCAENAWKERRLASIFEGKWASIRERARAVISGGGIPVFSGQSGVQRVEVEISPDDEDED